MDDKVCMEEVLNNTGWTSADAELIYLPLNRPAMCRLAFTGAHQHHHLDHLIILVAPLEQADFGDATGMEGLTEEDRWLLPPLCFFQLYCQVRFDVCFSWHVVRRCVRRERGVRVCARTTLALQPDFGVFLAPLRPVLRGSCLLG